MEARKKWITTVEYYDEEGNQIILINKTKTYIETEYQIIKKYKYVSRDTNTVHRQNIVRRKPKQGEFQFD